MELKCKQCEKETDIDRMYFGRCEDCHLAKIRNENFMKIQRDRQQQDLVNSFFDMISHWKEQKTGD